MCHFALKTITKGVLSPVQVKRIFELDLNEKKTEEQPLSYEDRKFMTKVSRGINQRDDGHYEMPLPLKEELVTAQQ